MRKWIERNGKKICFDDCGVGEPLVLLHGFLGESIAWGAPLLRNLEQHFRLVCFDLLGHGASDSCSDPMRFSLSEMIADVEAVLDSLLLSKVTLLGYSMGGRIALGFTLQYPERINCLLLESSSPGIAAESLRAERRIQDESWAERAENHGTEAFVADWSGLAIFQSQLLLPRSVLDCEKERRLKQDALSIAACLRGLGQGVQPSLWEGLSRCDVETHLVVGEFDQKYQEIATRMESQLKDSKCWVVPGAGHRTHLEQPDQFYRFILKIVNNQSDKGDQSDADQVDSSAII